MACAISSPDTKWRPRESSNVSLPVYRGGGALHAYNRIVQATELKMAEHTGSHHHVDYTVECVYI